MEWPQSNKTDELMASLFAEKIKSESSQNRLHWKCYIYHYLQLTSE